MEEVIYTEKPDLDNPLMIIGFEGWPNAGEVSSFALQHLIGSLKGKKFASEEGRRTADDAATLGDRPCGPHQPVPRIVTARSHAQTRTNGGEKRTRSLLGLQRPAPASFLPVPRSTLLFDSGYAPEPSGIIRLAWCLAVSVALRWRDESYDLRPCPFCAHEAPTLAGIASSAWP